jgi:hypothetical protein
VNEMRQEPIRRAAAVRSTDYAFDETFGKN